MGRKRPPSRIETEPASIMASFVAEEASNYEFPRRIFVVLAT